MVREGALDRAALFFNVLVFQANLTKQTEINQRNQINQKDVSTHQRFYAFTLRTLSFFSTFLTFYILLFTGVRNSRDQIGPIDQTNGNK